jgi:hypothetical protein
VVDAVFEDGIGDLRAEPVGRAEVVERAVRGGYLPALSRTDRRRAAWFDSYVAGVIDREVRAVSEAAYLRELPRLLRLVASRTSGELNVADVARDMGMSRPTTDAYLAHLEAVFLVQTVPAWSTNLTSRAVRRPKVGLTDTGLAARLLGGRLQNDPDVAGRLVETFVTSEIRAQCEWSVTRPHLFHYRDREGYEVDLLLESADGRTVGIEVKAGATVRSDDLRGLRLLERRLGDDFAAGVVLCTCPAPVHLGGRLWTLPMSVLWSSTAEPD